MSEKAISPDEIIQKAKPLDREADPHHAALPLIEMANRAKPIDYEECLSCQ